MYSERQKNPKKRVKENQINIKYNFINKKMKL